MCYFTKVHSEKTTDDGGIILRVGTERGSNIVLIGMPYAGKSETGPRLARALLMEFLDTDLLIQAREGRTLQQLIDTRGTEAFQELEELHVRSLGPECHVVATGGSVVYRDAAMKHLRHLGTIVFLDVPLEELETRATGIGTRGLVISPGMKFSDLYRERLPLYQNWADLAIDCGRKPPVAVVSEITQRLAAHKTARP